MGHAEHNPATYTPEEYFALEAQSDVRHEYFDGEIFAMAGTSKPHNAICLNLALAFRTGLRGSGCKVYMESIRTAVQRNFHYTYPDVVVSCHPDDRRDKIMISHPVLIAEVLSPGTEEYDRSTKLQQYQKLPSLRHYLLVAQTSWRVEWYRRTEAGEWLFTILTQPTDVLEIPDLGLKVALADIYDDTDVAPLRVAPPTGQEEF
jgi:Uma2 family endonuclease